MDGSNTMVDIKEVLQASLEGVATWPEVRTVVRAWAASREFLPCTTIPVEHGLQIAYHEYEVGCQKLFISVPAERLLKFREEFEAGFGGW